MIRVEKVLKKNNKTNRMRNEKVISIHLITSLINFMLFKLFYLFYFLNIIMTRYFTNSVRENTNVESEINVIFNKWYN